ncbi:gluconokinase [Gluconacetobacter tumulisoli]|uniref:Gluconokinase n=1 Tax=Gluconacetobacter tumulisoli TaxID=1286189 RepID=A0A7W4PM20_9PROT|nr:gluconokinase [Gluconacetobacter tumulisoli]MBB2202750.1 gluconokinase [Gluconacetobacter tumulisoli]
MAQHAPLTASVVEPPFEAPHIPLAKASTRLKQVGAPRVLVVMGVSGSGKSTLAQLLARRIGWPIVEGDELHPEANIAKMSKGIPLTDEDRAPWLEKIAEVARSWLSSGGYGIVTCSSLKRHYREIISGGDPEVGFVYLKGRKEDIAPRLGQRTGHFMPSTMLNSQFEALEEPDDGEVLLELDVMASRARLVEAAFEALRELAPPGHPLTRI